MLTAQGANRKSGWNRPNNSCSLGLRQVCLSAMDELDNVDDRRPRQSLCRHFRLIRRLSQVSA